MINRLRSFDLSTIRERTHPLLKRCYCLLLCFVLSALPVTALGQTDNLPTDLWTTTAEEAVTVLSDPETSTDRLEDFRAELSGQRGQALEAQDKLKLRVDTLQGELDSLGPAPEEGATEASEIATKRSQLDERIAEAKVPLLEAQSAYERADGLIAEIDGVIRGRLSAELTSLGPSPVNPLHWPDAVSELVELGERIVGGYRSTLADPSLKTQFISRMPFAAILILLGLVVQFYGKPRSIREISAKFHEAPAGGVKLAWRFTLTIVRNLLPVIAAIAVILGLDQLDSRSREEMSLTGALVPMALVVVLSYWLGNALFSPDDPELAVMKAEPRVARGGRRNALLIAVVLALMILVQFVVGEAELSVNTTVILMFPLFLLGSLFLGRLALLIRSRPVQALEVGEETEPTTAPATNVVRDVLSRTGFVIALVVPILALVGYSAAAKALFAPTAYSFGLIGGVVAIYSKFRDAVDTWLDAGDASTRSYRKRFRAIPLIGGLILTCASAPLFALIWGARVSELQEVWIWLRDGVTIGDVRLSVTDILAFILVFAIGYTITRMIQAVIKGSVLPRTDLDRGASNAIISGVGYVGIFLSAVIAISATGLSLGNLAIVAGALSVGIGFGLQTIVSNFVSGIILLVERPIKEGDWIEVAGFSGYVRKISVRSTLIDTFDKAAVIVPNSELIAGTVLNWTHSEMTGRVIVPVGVAYGEDPRKVEKILLSIAESHPMVLRRPAPAVVFTGFGADSMDFEIRAFLRDVNWMLSAKSEMNFSIVKRFEEEGVEIPYAQRDINLRNVDQAAKAFWQGKRDAER